MSEQAPNGGRSGCFTFLGILMIMSGLFAIVSPFQATLAFTVAIGWLLVFAGIMRAIWAFFKTEQGWKRVVWDLIVGVVYVAAGIAIANNIIVGAKTVTFTLAIILLVQGVLEIVGAFAVRPAKEWIWLLVGGVLALILGFMIWSNFPLSAAWAPGLLIGIQLLFTGFGMLMGRKDPSTLMGGGGGGGEAPTSA